MSNGSPAPDRHDRLAERLAAGTRRRFWGREAELDVFRAALAGQGPPFAILYVHGIGGVGKSTLLREYAAMAAQAGVRAVRVDGRMADPSPEAFLLALRDASGPDSAAPTLARLRETDRVVLIVDSYELLTPIDAWVRDSFLPQLAANTIVVLAARTPPPAEWKTDLGWAPLLRTLELRNLSSEAGRGLLTERHVPEAQQSAVLAFTHGHPLALVLAADVVATAGTAAAFSPESAPHLVRALLERIAAGAPSARHRNALELCAHARVTTEALIAAMIDREDAHVLFEWLRGLSFVEQGHEGLFPHDVVRETLDADFRWRDRGAYQAMHRRLFLHLRDRLRTDDGRAQQQAFFDKLYLHRFNPIGSRYHDYGTLGSIYAETATAHDHAAIVESVRRYEGDESARIARYWIERQPKSFQLIRDADGRMMGFVASVSIGPDSSDGEADPAVRAALSFARSQGPLRPGDEMVHHRFHMACDGYQGVFPTINLVATMVTLTPARRPRLAWSFITFGEADPWRSIMNYINFQHAPGAGFEAGGHRYAVFAHDWRVETFDAWWEREIACSLGSIPDPDGVAGTRAPSLVVMSESDFAVCVRQALRDYARGEALGSNPLLRSRLVVESGGREPPAARLQSLLREAVERLEASERDEKFYRALWHTFIQPAPSQERCAERLGLPFGTYRYHLARGTERVVEWLWQRELHGTPPASQPSR